MKQSRQLYCDSCLVAFEIKVEPQMVSVKEVESNSPKSLKWLIDDDFSCPVCGGEVRDEE